MKTYEIKFYGRPNGSIGIKRPCKITVLADDEAEARMKIYDTHEHVAGALVTEIKGPEK